MVKIFIADDHKILREGIRKILELEEDFVVVGEASDGEETLAKLKICKPDILLIDINMPRLNGIEVLRRLSGIKVPTKAIVLTIHDDENYAFEVVKAGASGYLLKDIDSNMLITAIRSVVQGESFFQPTLAKRLFEEMIRRSNKGETLESTDSKPKLTRRELHVIELMGKGMSNMDIAKALFLSEKTVKNHLTNIFRKLNVNDRTKAVLYAIKHKMLILSE